MAADPAPELGDVTTLSLSAELSNVNVQLMNHGWTKKPLNLGSLSAKDHNEVVSVLFQLLGSTVNNMNTLEAMAGRHRNLTYEFERLQKSNNSLKLNNARLETETTAWKVRCTEIEKRLALEENKTKELREEVGRGRKALDGVRVAAGHETKKVQLKLDKALSQLTKYSENPQQQRSQGLVLLNPIPAGKSQPLAATQSPLLEQTFRDLADIRESLQEETEAFRHVLVSTGNGLMEALAASEGREAPPRLGQSNFFAAPTAISRNQQSQIRTSTTQSASSTSHPFLANNRLQSLVAEIRAKLTEGVPKFVLPGAGEGSLGPTPEELEEQKRLEREQEKLRRDLEDRVKDLEVELICAKKREEEAERVVDEMARKELEHVTTKGEMDEGLRKQQKLMEVELRQVAENKTRLEQERRQFETERQAFVEEKRQADVDAVLALLPSTPDELDVLEAADDEPEFSASPSSSPRSNPILSSPGPSNWHAHMPQSPSPLSPAAAKPRTPKPKHHLAGGNRRKSIKTPLSRLVLEKAVRSKGKDGLGRADLQHSRAGTAADNGGKGVTGMGLGLGVSVGRKASAGAGATRSGHGSATGSGSGSSLSHSGASGSVLGNEGGRKTNLASSSGIGGGQRPSSPSTKKGKERAELRASTTTLTSAAASARELGKGRSSSVSSISAFTSTSTSTGSGAIGRTRPKQTTTIPVTSTSTSRASAPTIRPNSDGNKQTQPTSRTEAQRKVDLGKVSGIGPRAAARSKGVWR